MVLAVVALELLFRILPVSTSTETGYYFDPMILTYPAHHEFTTSSGWDLDHAQRHRSNNFGFLADHEFVRNPAALALIGDSYVEASMLDPRDRLAAQLERILGGRTVYALGAPGTSLLDYAERVRFAAQHFGVRDFVVALEHGDIGEVLCGSGNVVAACLDPRTLQFRVERLPPPGRAKRVLRHSALAQYLFSQLSLDPAAWLRALLRPAGSGVPRPARNFSDIPPHVIEAALDQFFARIQPYRCGALVLVLLNDSRSGASIAGPDPIREHLRAAAARHGAVFIDAWPQVHRYEQVTGLSPFVSPQNTHLNGLALGIVARQVAAAVATMPSEAARCRRVQGLAEALCASESRCLPPVADSAAAIFLRNPGSG